MAAWAKSTGAMLPFCKFPNASGKSRHHPANEDRHQGTGDLDRCEAKVFDGANRDVDWVEKGIGQAAFYANQWGESVGYTLVYNVKLNARLTFTGARQIGELWSTERQGKTIRIVSLDLGVDVPASQSGSIQEIQVPS